MYYLKSRYYNPEWGRFINADAIAGQIGELLGHNLFAYCKNSPVAWSDKTGLMREIADDGSTPGGMGFPGSLSIYEEPSVTSSYASKWGGKSLLSNEGKVGTYDELIDAGVRGDNITPHHMPSAKYMETNAGVPKGDGITMNMEHPYPGVGGRHRLTNTYGMAGERLQQYLNLDPRNALAHDIMDARRIYRSDGLYTSDIRRGLQDVISMSKDLFPYLFKK